MGITPGEDYTARYTVASVGLQIGKRNGFTLQGLTLEGISEEQLQWQAKDAESTTRGISFEMPAHNVTVTVNWKANGSSRAAVLPAAVAAARPHPATPFLRIRLKTALSPYLPNLPPRATL